MHDTTDFITQPQRTHMHPAITNFTTKAFDIKHYKDFITYAFGDEEGLELMQESYKNPNDHSKYTYTKLKQEYCLLPEPIEWGGGQTLEVYAFKVESIHARVGLYKDLKEKLRDTGSHALLACLFQDNSPHFRLSLITRSLNEKGEIDYSHPKRQSFLLGKDIKTNSAKQQLSKLQGASSLEDIEEAFSLEQLSREFFQAITKHFTHLYENIKFPKDLNEEASRAFSLRLLARVLFCKFLERKGLIPSSIWDTSLSEHYYYHEVLEPLFFGTLNTPKSERNYGLLDSKITHLLDSIPYLNGGLFSPQENDFYEPKSPQAYINTLQVPTTILTELFKELSKFHFTLDESTPIDQEVGLDPEMLGMVFENLLSMLFTDHKIDNLSSLRKQTGSYYTPREIVSYMAKSCILEYLKTHTTISDSSLRSLVFEYEHEFGYQEILSLLTALSGFRVLDPACGSGAFPMGILQELTQILEALDEEGTAFMALQSQEFKASHQDKDPRYIRKLHILQNNIYGVDIQPMATEISRLRCFLSLICDEDKNKIEPLPNLEFKFLTANSLMPLEANKEQKLKQQTFDGIFAKDFITRLQNIHSKYINSKPEERQDLKDEFYEIHEEIKKEDWLNEEQVQILESFDPFNSISKAEFFDSAIMFGVEKFDCVIGNPPYGASLSQEEQKKYKKIHNSKSSDTAQLFIFQADKILKPRGINSFIVPKALTFATNWKQIRDFLQDDLRQIIDCGKAWSYVLLEMIIFSKVKQSPTESYITGFLSEDESLSQVLEIDKKHISLFDFYLNDLKKEEVSVGIKLRGYPFLETCCKNTRGVAYQSYLKKSGKYAFIGGKEIDRYGVKFYKGYYDDASSTPKNAFIRSNSLLVQNIVAHIQNPTPHIKIIAMIPSQDILLLDTINQLVFENIEARLMWALLNSKLLNWYVYRFIFAKAIRTMHFDSPVSNKIPIPKIDSTNQSIADKIIALVEEILEKKKHDSATDTTALESQINKLVYTLYNLTDEEIELIEGEQ